MGSIEEESFLVYEQDEVQLCGDSNEKQNATLGKLGKLRIVEKSERTFIEWAQCFDESNDSEWAFISAPAVSFSSRSHSDSIKINNIKKNVNEGPVSIEILENWLCRVSDKEKFLEVLDPKMNTKSAFIFHKSTIDYFLNVLRRYVHLREQDVGLFLFQNKRQAEIDDKLSALNLVPNRRSPTPRRVSPSDAHPSQWVADAPKKFLGFIHDMKKNPYSTTVNTLSKVYELVLYNDEFDESREQEDQEEVGEWLQRISGNDDLEPGFEILTKREQLAERSPIERSSTLAYEEYKTYVEADGRILRVDDLKKRIFRGGIHPNLRPELWCLLLGVYDWNLTTKEKDDLRLAKEHEYFVMKQQWKTISEEQERNFAGYRDRKSLIEKDVNRTDRNHPFYEGEENSNLEMLNDILMTYIMYNFDLGYVQGMSDLLAPILYVVQNEPIAFWCFVGYMNRVYRNFDLDQSGMKQQLSDLSQVLKIIDAEFMSFLEAQDSANLFFCFRWLLVRFKRELSYTDTLRLWEVLWTNHLSTNFHLCVAAAILDSERDEIMENKSSFTDVLKHINGLSMRMDLENILSKAEAIHIQLSKSPPVPDSVRTILNIPLAEKHITKNQSGSQSNRPTCRPGHVERVDRSYGHPTSTSRSAVDGHSTPEEAVEALENGELFYDKAIMHSFN